MHMKSMALSAMLLAMVAGQALAQENLGCRITQTSDRDEYPKGSVVELVVRRGDSVRLGDSCVVGRDDRPTASGVVVQDSGSDFDSAHAGPKAHVSHGH